MITKLLKEYTQVRVSYEAIGKDPSSEVTKVLLKLESELRKRDWKCPSDCVYNDTVAMCAFFEMYARKIGGDAPIMLCYYYSSRVANNRTLSESARVKGNKHRAFIVFKAMNQLSMTFNIACNAPIAEYRGRLNNNQFVDILLLSDVYKAWNADNNSTLLQNLKRQTPIVAANHPTFTKQQIIMEGELAHEAVLNIVSTIVE